MGSVCGACAPCSTATGVCVPNPGANCSDGNACTNGDKCLANGTCGPGSAVTCTGADECRTVGACVPATGCPSPVAKTGADCDDGNLCNINESCQASGTCGGGTKAPITTGCGNNKFCDGKGACKCRTQSSWNLLSNPGFNDSSSPWVLNGTSGVSYKTDDVDACSGSGSILIEALLSTFGQCQQLPQSQTGRRTFYFGYRFKPNSGGGQVACTFYFLPSTANCNQFDGTSSYILPLEVSGSIWHSASGSGLSDTNTTHAYVHCAGPGGSGYFDQFYLSTTAPPSMPAF
jgi:hypothetical protein